MFISKVIEVACSEYSPNVFLRLGGNLPSLEELTQSLGLKPTKFQRRGNVLRQALKCLRISKKRVQPVDVWILELAKFDSDTTTEERNNQMLQAATTLEKMSSSLAMLDRTDCNADLYISTIREEDQGGLSLPPKLFAAAASGELSIQISILVMLDDYSEAEQESSLSNTAVIDT